jgi:hypothetical protein
MTKEEIAKICIDFSDEFGEIVLLKANIAAINKMLISRGRDQELYGQIVQSIEEFKAKIAKKQENL